MGSRVPDGYINVPNSAVLRSAGGFMSQARWGLRTDGDAVIRFHPTWCHMQPWVVAALGAYGLAAARHEMTVDLENDHTAGYAWRMGLTDCLGRELVTPVQEHEEIGRFVAMRQIRTGAHATRLVADVAPLLHLADQPEQAKVVQYVLSEMIRNVLEHSRSPDGALVAAQVYTGRVKGRPTKPRRAYVSLGIADCGIGVPATLEPRYEDVVDDRSAVLKAMEFGTTGAETSAENAGAGLYFTRRLCDATRGYFALASRTAMFRTSLAQRRPTDPSLVLPVGSYPGTIVCIEIGLGSTIDLASFLAEMRGGFATTSARVKQRANRVVRFT